MKSSRYLYQLALSEPPHRRDRVFIVGHNALTDTDRRADGRGAGENEGESRKERLQERDEIRLADQPSQVRPAGERNADADTTQQRSDGARFELEQSEAGCKKQGKSRGSSRSNGSEWLDAYAGINGLQGVLHGEGDEDAQRKGQTSPLTTDAIGSIQPGKCWRDFPLVSPVHRRNDGLPFNVDDLTISYNKWRNETLKAYGNAIVPQVMYEIFRTIESVENGTYDTTNGF